MRIKSINHYFAMKHMTLLFTLLINTGPSKAGTTSYLAQLQAATDAMRSTLSLTKPVAIRLIEDQTHPIQTDGNAILIDPKNLYSLAPDADMQEFLLGHELAHISEGHGALRIECENKAQQLKLLALVTALGTTRMALTGPPQLKLYSALIIYAVLYLANKYIPTLLLAHHAREQELQADAISAEKLNNLPGGINYFTRRAQLEKAGAQISSSGLFTGHPNAQTRLEQLLTLQNSALHK